MGHDGCEGQGWDWGSSPSDTEGVYMGWKERHTAHPGACGCGDLVFSVFGSESM